MVTLELTAKFALFPDYTDTLLNMISFFDLVNHSNSIISIADDTFISAVKYKLFTAEDILTASLAVGLEISCGADISPLNILTLTKLTESLRHSCCQRLECIREIRTVSHACGMLRVYIKAARTADNQKTGICT